MSIRHTSSYAKLGALLFALSLSTPAIAAKFDDSNKISLSANITPQWLNAETDHIPGASRLSKTAYLFNLKYQFDYHKKPFIPGFQSSQTYIALQAYRFLYVYDKASGKCFDGSTEGATELQGFAARYGQRLTNHTRKYGNAGIGWSIGLGKGTTNWTECLSEPIRENILIPIASTELFYTYHFNRFFYIEPTFSINVDAAGRGLITTPEIYLGLEF